MTEEVLVSIKGLHTLTDNGEDEVEVVTSGKYKQRENKHYIMYEEVIEGSDQKIHNLIKVEDSVVEVTKKGATNVHMSFEKGKKNLTYYDTPYGSLLLGISATGVEVKNTEDMIDVEVCYALEINEEHLADCRLCMNIQSKNQNNITLN